MIVLKTKFRWMAAIVAVATISFASCSSDGDENTPALSDTVKVKINNLPAAAGSSGMEGQLLVYPIKPAQFEDLEDGITTGVLMNGSADLIPVHPQYGSSPYKGGEGYLRIKTVNTLPLANTNMRYMNYISKNKVTLKPGDNTFNFSTDFEVLHQYGGEEGILTITDVPKEIVDQDWVFKFIVNDYPGSTDEGDATFELAMKAKPLAMAVLPTTDYLAIPLDNLMNQEWIPVTIDGYWYHELAEERFKRGGMYFIYTEGIPTWYASQVVFTYGSATISWSDLKIFQ